MIMKFTLLDLINAFREYSSGSVHHIDKLTDKVRKRA